MRKKPSESVNASQLHVDRHKMGSIHPVDGKPPQPSSIVHTMTGISEYLDSTVLGNHEESPRVNNIFRNYIHSGESYNYKPTTVDIHFSTMIANNLYNDPDPKTMAMAEFEKHSFGLESIKGCNPRRNSLAQ